MMSPHRSHDDGGRYPSHETLELVRRALAWYLSGAIDDDQVCEALATLAAEAQERKLNAEHMLVAFKATWSELPEVRAIRDPAERRRLLDHLVSFCIDAYYKPK